MGVFALRSSLAAVWGVKSMSTIGGIVGAILAVTALVLVFANAIVMLLSPRMFFSLPNW